MIQKFLLHALLAFTKCLCIQTLTLLPLYYRTFNLYFYILLLLLNSSCEMNSEFSIIICLLFSCTALEMVLLLYSALPDRGFLTELGDGVLFSKVGSALGLSTSTNSSPQSEELHHHLVLPYFSHVSQ